MLVCAGDADTGYYGRANPANTDSSSAAAAAASAPTPAAATDNAAHCKPQPGATHCNILQHTATYCNTLQQTMQLTANPNQVQYTATYCNMLQHTATHCNRQCSSLQTPTRCNTLQRTATHCNILQHTATYCNTLQHTMYLTANPNQVAPLYLFHVSGCWRNDCHRAAAALRCIMHCVVVCSSMLQCVAVIALLLHCAAATLRCIMHCGVSCISIGLSFW